MFELDGGRSRLSAGDVAFVARGTRFSYRNETGAAARLLLVQTPSFDPAAEVLD